MADGDNSNVDQLRGITDEVLDGSGLVQVETYDLTDRFALIWPGEADTMSAPEVRHFEAFSYNEFHSLSYAAGVFTFYANTEEGCICLLSTSPDVVGPSVMFRGQSVYGMCATQDKLLVTGASGLKLHKYPTGHENTLRYSMPPTRYGDVVSYGKVCTAIREGRLSYCLTDHLNGVVHVWNPYVRCWENEIDMRELTGHYGEFGEFVFHMCTDASIFYFTIFSLGEIMAYDDQSKRILWQDASSSHEPLGIQITHQYLLICEAFGGCPCVVVMTHDGRLLSKVLQSFLNGPCLDIATSYWGDETDAGCTVAIASRCTEFVYVEIFDLDELVVQH